jgi:hypothetical protein
MSSRDQLSYSERTARWFDGVEKVMWVKGKEWTNGANANEARLKDDGRIIVRVPRLSPMQILGTWPCCERPARQLNSVPCPWRMTTGVRCDVHCQRIVNNVCCSTLG